MVTKLKAARRLGAQGVASALLSGRRPGALAALLAGEPVGTVFSAASERLSARDGWLSSAAKARGTIMVDAGARRAVVEQGKSLLPSGIKGVLGQFGVGDPVELAVEASRPFARGLAGYAADDVRRLAGKKTSQIEEVLGFRDTDEVVHRNDLVLLEALA
jgi:glutamate 5-kinase